MRKRMLVMAAAIALVAAPLGVGATGMPSDDDPGGGDWVAAGSSCHNPGWRCPCYVPKGTSGTGQLGVCQCTRVKMPWGYENVWLPV